MALQTFPSFRAIGYPIKRRPRWNTLIHTAVSGKQNTLQTQSAPFWSYEFPITSLRSDAAYQEMQSLFGFINLLGGRAGLFLYDDPDDDTATAQVFAIGDGVTTTFQLVRTFGGFVEPVYALNGAPTISADGVPLVAGVDYTIGSYASITFTVAPGNGSNLSWSGQFLFLCRFDSDVIELQRFGDVFWEGQSISFTTQKP